MRRSSKRLGQVLESYDHAATLRAPRAVSPAPRPRLVTLAARQEGADDAAHEAYRQGVAEQAGSYLDELRRGERVTMHFEYHRLSPIDGGPRDIDVLDELRRLCRDEGMAFSAGQIHDIGVHLTRAESWG
jgi:hypothetical protein